MSWCYRQHWPIFNLVLVLSLLTFIWLYYIDFWYHFRLETSILMNRIRQLKDASNWCLSDGGRLLSKLLVSRGFFLRVAYIGTYSHMAMANAISDILSAGTKLCSLVTGTHVNNLLSAIWWWYGWESNLEPSLSRVQYVNHNAICWCVTEF